MGTSSVSWVRIPPRPLQTLRLQLARPGITLAEPRETPSFSEGWQNGNAPVSKTGALTGLWVRIPPPPLPHHSHRVARDVAASIDMLAHCFFSSNEYLDLKEAMVAGTPVLRLGGE